MRGGTQTFREVTMISKGDVACWASRNNVMSFGLPPCRSQDRLVPSSRPAMSSHWYDPLHLSSILPIPFPVEATQPVRDVQLASSSSLTIALLLLLL